MIRAVESVEAFTLAFDLERYALFMKKLSVLI